MIDASALLDARILIVDDLQVNVTLLEQILRGAGYARSTSTTNPAKVCELHRRNRYDLIVLDIQMPVMDGFQVMEQLKQIDPDDYLPVLVITAQPDHKLHALKAGARDFISKPLVVAEVLARVRNLLEVRLLHRALRSQSLALEERVRERTAELKATNQETIFALIRAAEYNDGDTGAHVQRISHCSSALATILGLDETFVDAIFFASAMHDIGKLGVPAHILLKPGPLTPAEWEVMKGHTTIGAKILGNSSSPYLVMGAEIALNHHERWDFADRALDAVDLRLLRPARGGRPPRLREAVAALLDRGREPAEDRRELSRGQP